MKRFICGLVLALVLLPLGAQTIIIVQSTAGCTACTVDWASEGGEGHATNLGGGSANLAGCCVSKLIAPESACGGTAPNDITFWGRNFTSTSEQARIVVYTHDAINDEPADLAYEGGCFYDTASGSLKQSVKADRTADPCTSDGDGQIDGRYTFPCADAPDDIWWVGWCAEVDKYHWRYTSAAPPTDADSYCAHDAGYYNAPPDPWNVAGDNYFNGKHSMEVDW